MNIRSKTLFLKKNIQKKNLILFFNIFAVFLELIKQSRHKAFLS